MSKPLTAALAVLVLVWAAGCVTAQTAPAVDSARGPNVVHVAPPTGDMQTDRASILAALERVRPSGTVQFAPGTYLLGGFIPVSVSGVTLLGHPNGTTLRGCDPADRSTPDGRIRCNTLALIGSRQVVRDLTFEYMSWGLTVGMVPRGSREFVYHAGEGGHLIEGNTFRDSYNGVRVFGDWPEPVVVRGNRFINTYHAGDIFGRRAHFLNNDISAPDPTRLTPFRHVGGATQIAPLDPVPGDVGLSAAVDCEENVIAGNRYDGHPDAIVMYISREGSCRNNVIRDNTIIVRRVRFFADRSPGPIRHETDSTLVGIPLVLADWSEESSTESRGVIENNVIEGNRIIGAEGLGIMLHRASRNRVADNTITGIRRREPFPGNVLWGIDEEQWRHANGSAIWISPGSDGNEIIGNTFDSVVSHAVVLEGERNRVELRSSSDRVRDLGTGNRVTGPGSSTEDVRRDEPLYESKFVETRGIRLQYMDFGGSGLPVIFLQDFHNYFDPEWDSEWPGFYARFADAYRVLAPIRRGYGGSDDTGWGYDVATQSEDLLGLMDALGIRRAVLVGRQPANQDMTWIAEHHPERVAGLVYMGNPLVFPDLRNPLVRTFEEMTWRSCDLGERSVPIVGPRAAWRPDFLHDEHARIAMPALRFVSPWDTRTVALRVLPQIAATGVNSRCDDEPRREYFAALAADEEQVAAIREALEEADLFPALDRAMERAFGVNLRTEVDDLPKRDGWGATHEFYEPHMRRFLEEVARAEAARQPPRPDLH